MSLFTKAREDCGLSRSVFARELGISPERLRALERSCKRAEVWLVGRLFVVLRKYTRIKLGEFIKLLLDEEKTVRSASNKADGDKIE